MTSVPGVAAAPALGATDLLDVLNVVGFAVGVAGLLLAAWGIRQSRGADRRLESLDERSELVLQDVGRVLEVIGAPHIQGSDRETIGAEADRPHAVGYADVDGDERQELLVGAPYGPHSSVLYVLGFPGAHVDELQVLGTLASGTPSGFTVGDLDRDGRIEAATIQPRNSHPYAAGIRDEVLYRWSSDDFHEVARNPLPNPGEGGADPRWHLGNAVLTIQ